MGARGDRPSGDRIVAVIEGQDWLDKPSYKIEHGMTLVLNLLGPAGVRVRDFLHGRWFGHPLHPMLTDIPVGAWTAALVLDGMAVLAPRPAGFKDAARAAVGAGLAGATVAALAGLADWQFTHDNARRVGLVHGTLNAAATGLYSLSWVQRRRGADHRARWAGAAGWAVMAASSYLGGSLVYRHRIGVDHSDKELEPRQFTPVLAEGELGTEPRQVQAHGIAVVLARADGAIYALGEHCPHLGGPLSKGHLSRGQIICPWHGSRFDLATGACRRGPATTGPPRFATRVRAGQIEVRRIPPVPTAPPGRVLARQQHIHDQEEASHDRRP